MSFPALPENVVPCPVCKRSDRMVREGMLCFVCETQTAREVANDMPRINRLLASYAAFHDWCVENDCP